MDRLPGNLVLTGKGGKQRNNQRTITPTATGAGSRPGAGAGEQYL